MKNFAFLAFVVVLMVSMLTGCIAPPPVPTAAPTTTPVPLPTATATPDLPQTITIFYEDNAQFEVVGPSGTRVLFDVINTLKLSSPATAKDILLITHTHSDHYSADFSKAFPGEQIAFQDGEINLPDVKIKSIISAHNAGDPLEPEKATNYIFVVDIGGIRIAHFGDIGQDKLTDDQLKALGNVDIAITQFDNTSSDMSSWNEKGINLMAQLKPKLIIPTAHISLATMTLAAKKWKGFVRIDSNSIKIGRADLPTETSVLVFGVLATSYQKIFKWPSWASNVTP